MTFTLPNGEMLWPSPVYKDGSMAAHEAPAAERGQDVMRDFLQGVEGAICGERQQSYGLPEKNHGCTASLWNTYLQRKYDRPFNLSASDVCILNVLQKLSRHANLPKNDNLLDVAGYAANAARIEGLDNVHN